MYYSVTKGNRLNNAVMLLSGAMIILSVSIVMGAPMRYKLRNHIHNVDTRADGTNYMSRPVYDGEYLSGAWF